MKKTKTTGQTCVGTETMKEKLKQLNARFENLQIKLVEHSPETAAAELVNWVQCDTYSELPSDADTYTLLRPSASDRDKKNCTLGQSWRLGLAETVWTGELSGRVIVALDGLKKIFAPTQLKNSRANGTVT